MQTFTQTFLGATNGLQFNVTGKYFTTLATNLGINVRFYKGGQKKSLGDITALLAGLEVTFEADDYFDRVEIDVLGADTISFGIGNGQSRYNRSQGNVTIIGTPNMVVTALPKVILDGLAYGSSYRSVTPNVANTAEQIFSAAANINGAIIHAAQFVEFNSGSVPNPVFLAKATAPASVVDGDVILGADQFNFFTSANAVGGSLKNQIKIPAGKGLFYITSAAQTVCSRGVLYTLL